MLLVPSRIGISSALEFALSFALLSHSHNLLIADPDIAEKFVVPLSHSEQEVVVALYATQTAGEDVRTRRISQVGRSGGNGVSSELDEEGETQELVGTMIVPVDLLLTGHTRQMGARTHIRTSMRARILASAYLQSRDDCFMPLSCKHLCCWPACLVFI